MSDSRSMLLAAALVGLGIGLLVVVLPGSASAGEYWVVGFPAVGEAGYGIGTTVAITNPVAPGTGGAPVIVATVLKVAAGTETVEAVYTIPEGQTVLHNFGDFISHSGIGTEGIHLVRTDSPAEVSQLTTGTSGLGAVNGGVGDATRITEEGKLGTDYVAMTSATIQNTCGGPCWIPPQNNVVTIIALKGGTTVQVTPSARTANSPSCQVTPCASPLDLFTMQPGTMYTYTLENRGDALSFMGDHITSVSCRTGCGEGYDLSGSIIRASTPVAVFAGSACAIMRTPEGSGAGGDTSCDAINDQMLPNSAYAKIYPLCALSKSRTGTQPGQTLGQTNTIRVRAVSGTAQVTFSGGVSATPLPTMAPAFNAMSPPPPAIGSPIMSASVPDTAYTQFWYTSDVVMTADAPVIVQTYITQSDVWSANRGDATTLGNLYNNNPVVRFTWGDPDQASMPPIENSEPGAHFTYLYPGWENHIIVATKAGQDVYHMQTDATTSTAPQWKAVDPARTRLIPGSDYQCTHIMDLAESGGTHAISTGSENAVVTTMGLALSAGYMYNSGAAAIPLLVCPSPPGIGPCPPTAFFKPISASEGCGMRPIAFRDQSTPGSGSIVSYVWDFGDGTMGTGANPTHTYAAAGQYIVTETITNDGGLSATYAFFVNAVDGGACPVPNKSQDDGMKPRPPRDSVDGEIADGDFEPDGVPNFYDNCVYVANPTQADTDADGAGDACDADDDNDGVVDLEDNCPLRANTSQANLDGDDEGDACDDDIDGDAVANMLDNCRLVANTDQDDTDGDQAGDACDEARALIVSREGAPDRARDVAGAAGQTGPDVPWPLVALGAAILVAVVVALALLRRRA